MINFLKSLNGRLIFDVPNWYDTCCSPAKSVISADYTELLPSEMRFGARPIMLPLLLAARTGIILWLTLALMPFEVAIDAIEAEIDREMTANG
ncbi:hypothetical protein [Bradyrhizobium icense]|uniref:hypothetical protein n=1 Tax=Bradyrhizobium icense TaxID=1274631 RepID=UPI0012E9F745|nr:hypothetical protein [Bradyrhizobium icense]